MRPALAPWAVLGFALVARTAVAEETVDYAKQIQPILAGRCYSCHGALKQKNKLRTDSVKSLLDGGGQRAGDRAGQEPPRSLPVELPRASGEGRMPPPGRRRGLECRANRADRALDRPGRLPRPMMRTNPTSARPLGISCSGSTLGAGP